MMNKYFFLSFFKHFNYAVIFNIFYKGKNVEAPFLNNKVEFFHLLA